MLTDLEQIPTRRPTLGRHFSATVPCALPDSQALLELSLREIEAAANESHGKLHILISQLATESLRTREQVDRARNTLAGICAGYLKHLKVIQERIAARFHPQGRFGATIDRLQAEMM